jgi:hypothetical protein
MVYGRHSQIFGIINKSTTTTNMVSRNHTSINIFLMLFAPQSPWLTGGYQKSEFNQHFPDHIICLTINHRGYQKSCLTPHFPDRICTTTTMVNWTGGYQKSFFNQHFPDHIIFTTTTVVIRNPTSSHIFLTTLFSPQPSWLSGILLQHTFSWPYSASTSSMYHVKKCRLI